MRRRFQPLSFFSASSWALDVPAPDELRVLAEAACSAFAARQLEAGLDRLDQDLALLATTVAGPALYEAP